MGLILFLLYPLLELAGGHLLPTELYARSPAEWLRLAGQTRATHLASPQSSWLSAVRAAGRAGTTLDLSSVQVASVAAEGVDPRFVDRLRLAPGLRLRHDALGGSYGLAEATLIVTASGYREGMVVHTVDRDVLQAEGRAVAPRGHARRVVSMGRPLGSRRGADRPAPRPAGSGRHGR